MRLCGFLILVAQFERLMDLLRTFLRHYAAAMSRTALRYAIEQKPDNERRMWMKS